MKLQPIVKFVLKVTNVIYRRHQKITILQIIQRHKNMIPMLIEKQYIDVFLKNII